MSDAVLGEQGVGGQQEVLGRAAASDAVARGAAVDAAQAMLPFIEGPLYWGLLAYILVLLCIPPYALDAFGYDYSSLVGSPLTKIHLSTYLLVGCFGAFVIGYPDKGGLIHYLFNRKLGTLYFIGATTLTVIFVMLNKRNGFGMYFDTHLNAFCASVLIAFVAPRKMSILERIYHGFFLVNALVGLIELARGGVQFFPPQNFMNEQTEWETRSTALLGHPLDNANLTCVYVISLLMGGGKGLGGWLRAGQVMVQVLGLVAFGGRTALSLTLTALFISLLWQIVLFFSGKRFKRSTVILAALAVPLAVGAVSALASLGFFDQLFERINNDGGSARARVLMLDLLGSFNFRDLMFGVDPELIASRRYSYGLEWGVENPVIHMAIYQGGLFMLAMVSGLLLLLRDVYKRLRPEAIVPLLVFGTLCMSYESLSGRLIIFSNMIILLSTLFRRQEVPARVI